MLIFFIQKLWSTIFFLLCIDSIFFFSQKYYESSSFLYLSLPLHFTLLFYHWIRYLFSRIESCRRKCQIASFILSRTYLHIFEHMYMFVILFYRENIFLCSSNYSKFHLSKSVIFNVKFRIFLFFSFFVSFFLSFSFSFSFSLFLFFQNNIGSTVNLLNMMDKYDCRSIVFSSSATVSTSLHVHSEKNGKSIWIYFKKIQFL